MIYISTNMFHALNLEKVYQIVDSVDFDLGIEIFPMFHIPGYQELLEKNRDKLKKYPLTFHEPYYKTDHSYLEGDVFFTTKNYYEKLLSFQDLNPKYIVYHYNNQKIQDRDQMLAAARKNLDYLSQASSAPLLIENVGVESRENVLFNQEEFIEECLHRKEHVLIDIGHANANAWDLDQLLSALKGKIKSYHLHTNDGCHDLHQSIFKGGMTPDIEATIDRIKKYTPEADLVLEYGKDYDGQIHQVIEDVKRLHVLWTN